MSKESDAYALVIGDLKRQRDEIERTIARLEALAAGNPSPSTSTSTPEGDLKTDTESEQIEEPEGHTSFGGEGEFLGMKVIDAAKIVLDRRRKLMSPRCAKRRQTCPGV